MNNPTHFIEVWKDLLHNNIKTTHCLPIKYLTVHLKASNNNNCIQTIAIWKIKLK
jgi:hypothetical protein